MNDMFICHNKFHRFTPHVLPFHSLFHSVSRSLSPSPFRASALLLSFSCIEASHLQQRPYGIYQSQVIAFRWLQFLCVCVCCFWCKMLLCDVCVYHLARLAWAWCALVRVYESKPKYEPEAEPNRKSSDTHVYRTKPASQPASKQAKQPKTVRDEWRKRHMFCKLYDIHDFVSKYFMRLHGSPFVRAFQWRRRRCVCIIF